MEAFGDLLKGLGDGLQSPAPILPIAIAIKEQLIQLYTECHGVFLPDCGKVGEELFDGPEQQLPCHGIIREWTRNIPELPGKTKTVGTQKGNSRKNDEPPPQRQLPPPWQPHAYEYIRKEDKRCTHG